MAIHPKKLETEAAINCIFSLFPVLTGQNCLLLEYQFNEIRKERVEWLLSLIMNYDVQEIDEKFYELLPDEKQFDSSLDDSTNHPYDVDWSIYHPSSLL